MAAEMWRTRALEKLLPVSGNMVATVHRVGGSMLAVANIRSVISPDTGWKYDPALSYIHSFRLLDPVIRNGRDPNMITGVGPNGNLIVYMARVPESRIPELTDTGMISSWSGAKNFDRSPGGLALRYMRAYNMLVEPTLGPPIVALLDK